MEGTHDTFEQPTRRATPERGQTGGMSTLKPHPGASPESTALVERVAQQLRGRGERMTAPRRAVLTVLARDREHLSVDEIARRVATVAPGVHLASVYRTLEALAALGVVQHVHLGHGSTAYHLVDPGQEHAHAQCRTCGRVWDLPVDLLDSVADALRRDLSFELDPAHVALSGVCATCAE